MKRSVLVGGLVAAGFDPTGSYLLTVTHSGRGVFSTTTWERVARDSALAYPDEGIAIGIGPIEGAKISVKEKDFDSGVLRLTNPDQSIVIEYEDGSLTIDSNESP